MAKEIVFVANGYPTADNPIYAFLRPVVIGLADCDIHCTVIAPQSLTKVLFGKIKRRPVEWKDNTDKNNVITVLQPFFISIPGIKIFGNKLSALFCKRAIERSFKKIKEKPDCIYAHFWDSAINSCSIAKKRGIPVVVACGEESIWATEMYSNRYINRMIPQIRGVICVSTANYQKCVNSNLLRFNPITEIIVNGYDEDEFYHIDKEKAKKALKWSEIDKIISFVGSFSDRKGVKRVIEASKRIPEVKLILIGKGEELEQNEQIIFCGSLPHNKIVDYLNASDVFVLPTLSEGCCNAIVEAIACGLPIVSSQGDFNDDILDDSFSLRVDPMDIDQIEKAIRIIISDNELQTRMETNALRKSLDLTITRRIEKIHAFIDKVLELHNSIG